MDGDSEQGQSERQGNGAPPAGSLGGRAEESLYSSAELARQAAEIARAEAQGAAERHKGTGAQQIHGVAEAVHGAAREIEGQLPQFAGYIHEAAAKLEIASAAVRDQSVEDLLGSVGRFARNQPLAFFGGAMLAGFALSRFLKSSSERS